MLQNAYFLAKIGADTTENEQHFAEILPIGLVGEARGRRAFQILDTKKQGHMSRDEMDTVPAAAPPERTKISNILQIFSGLVLGCIKTKFCKKICVRQHFSSSTRFASFCTAAISKF